MTRYSYDVDAATDRRFKQYMLDTYGKVYGCQGDILRRALEEYLDRHEKRPTAPPTVEKKSEKRGCGPAPLEVRDPGLAAKMVAYHGAGDIVRECSRLAGVGDPAIGKDHITPHYFRVFFTTQILRAGMPRHYVQELRGDSGGAAIDVYTRIDREELRRAYLAHVPVLGL